MITLKELEEQYPALYQQWLDYCYGWHDGQVQPDNQIMLREWLRKRHPEFVE